MNLKFIVRLARFLVFQYFFQKRNLKYIILRLKAKNAIITRRIQGSKMSLNLKDKGISKDLALDSIREPESTNMIKKELKKGDVVIDIGANIGYYALMESRLVGNKGKVYAIEPVDENVKSLKKNIKLNNCSNIEVYKTAIGEKGKTDKMYIAEYSNWNSFIDHKRHIIGTRDIKVISLDNFLKNKKYPNFIRMDVEGYEYSIIKGMKKVLKSKRPLKLFIELHPHIMKEKQTIFVLKTILRHRFETKKVIRSVTATEMKVMPRNQYDYSSKGILDILKDNLVISGKLGAFQMFFERN